MGMYVVELDRPWTETPFIFQGFYLESDEQLETLKQYCKTVFVDPDPPKLAEPIALHDIVPPAQRRERVAQVMELVGLEPRFAPRYPHEFSGGQRQRIAIACWHRRPSSSSATSRPRRSTCRCRCRSSI